MPPTLELVFTRSPYALKAIQWQCHLCLRVLSFFRILRVICEARMVIVEHRGPFSCSEHTFLAFGHFLGGPGPRWAPIVVRGWICRDFGVPLELTLERSFLSFFSKKLSWVILSSSFCYTSSGEAFWSLLHGCLIPGDVKSMQNQMRVAENQGFTEIKKVCFLKKWVCQFCVISKDFG